MLGLFVFNYINYYKETLLLFAVFLSFTIAFHLLSHRLSAHPHVSCVPPVETSARVALLINHHNHIILSPQKLDFKAKDVFSWTCLPARVRWHLRTLDDFDHCWALGFPHSGKMGIYCSHLNVHCLTQCFQSTHIHCVMSP